VRALGALRAPVVTAGSLCARWARSARLWSPQAPCARAGRAPRACGHDRSRTTAAKFSSSRSPQRWLFSGWNWVAKSCPRSTAAGKRTP
jgi:hypothetical protein